MKKKNKSHEETKKENKSQNGIEKEKKFYKDVQKKSQRDENKKERRLVTAALPYINNIPHLGHIVGSHLPADIFSRFSKSKGYEVLFIGGSDENGSPCEIASEKIGVPLKFFLDKLYEEHKKIYDWFGISYDNFSRTSLEVHKETTQEFFKKINKNGYIHSGKIEVFYSPKEDRFLPDRYVIGTCPKCDYAEANGDQCENCSQIFDSTQLINPKSSVTGSEVEIREVEHLFLDLKKLSPKLKKWICSQKHWRNQVSSLALGWIKEGLKPKCITRDLKHGIPVPLKGFEDKVFYVWFDAPIGYVSSTKEVLSNNKEDISTNTKINSNNKNLVSINKKTISKNWECFWKDKNSKIYHFLGKDNIPFHTIFWPGIIMAEGSLNLPYQVVGLQYLNYEGGKFSKSKQRGIFCEKLLELEVNPDVWRAYLTQIIPEKSDSEFKWKEFQERINSDIIGNLGNFYNRVFTFIYNKLDGEIIKPSKTELDSQDKKLKKILKEKHKKITDYLENCEIRKAFSELLSLCSEGNKYFNDIEPWNSVKINLEKTKKRLYICANFARAISILSSPFIPQISKKAWTQLNLEGSPSERGIWNSADDLFYIQEKHKISKPEKLFEIIKDEDVEKYKKILSKGINLEDFFKKE